jgi:hypothetical protein
MAAHHDDDIDCSVESDTEKTHEDSTFYVKGPEDEIPPSKNGKKAVKKPFHHGSKHVIEFKTDHPLSTEGISQTHPRTAPQYSHPRGGNGGFPFSEEERQAKLYKTKMCKSIENRTAFSGSAGPGEGGGGTCEMGETCRYAHNDSELRCFFGMTCNKKDLSGGEKCKRLHVDVRDEIRTRENRKVQESSRKETGEIVVVRVPREVPVSLMEKIMKLITSRVEFRVEYA